MISRQFIFIVLVPIMVLADKIMLTTGKTIDGKITSYTSSAGLVVKTDDGNISINTANIHSFYITTDTTVSTLPIGYKDSKVRKMGLAIDTLKLKDFKITFDGVLLNSLPALVSGTCEDKALFFGFMFEKMGMPVSEYANLCIQSLKNNAEYTFDENEEKKTINRIEYTIKSIGVRTKGFELKYRYAFFLKDNINYRVLIWTYKSLYEKNIKEMDNILSSISYTK